MSPGSLARPGERGAAAAVATDTSLAAERPRKKKAEGALTAEEFEHFHQKLTKMSTEKVWSIPWQLSVRKARELAAKEGIFTGISSGATLATALDVAEDAPKGSVILAMLPDTGERYLSTPLFEGVNEGSDDDWLASL